MIRELTVDGLRRLRIPVLLALLSSENMQDLTPCGFQIIRNHRTMALPPQRLRTHNGRWPAFRFSKQSLDPGTKFLRLHIICVAAKCLVPPRAVRRVRLGISSPAQFRKMQIVDPVLPKSAAEILLVEM